jgi:hypothetical protein
MEAPARLRFGRYPLQRITFRPQRSPGIVLDRPSDAGARAAARGEIDRLQAGLAADPAERAFERRLSGAGAIGLLTLSLVGAAGLALLALSVALVAGIATAIVERRGRPIVSDDRWQLWRSVEPDPEYLRGGA